MTVNKRERHETDGQKNSCLLAPGTHAVGAYHDENNNSRLDTDSIGYLTEGYALSNGIRAVVSRPRFSDAAFAVGDEDAHVTLRIKY